VLFFILILLYIRLTIRQRREMSTTEAEYAIEERV